jgi:chromosome partitioning protein
MEGGSMKTPIVLGVANTKGGSSKSTTAINIGTISVANKLKTAILDMDTSQLTVMNWKDRRNGATEGPHVEAVTADKLEKRLADLKAKGFDLIILDLPGRDSPLLSAGVTAADFSIIPVRPTTVDVEASFNIVTRLVRSGKPYAFLISAAPPNQNKARALKVAAVLQEAGHPVIPTIIVHRLDVSDAITDGLGVNEAKPSSEAAQEFLELFRWIKGNVK